MDPSDYLSDVQQRTLSLFRNKLILHEINNKKK